MKNLLNFFFSFDKLFKEKLIVPVFWLALIYFGLEFLKTTIDAVHLDPLNWIIAPVTAIAGFLFTLLMVRIVAELAVAIFRINDNLSPDKGRSELVDIDPVAEARKAAGVATARTREMAATATEKTKATLEDVKTSVGDTTESLTARAKDATETVTARAKDATLTAREKTESVMGKGSVPQPGDAPTPVKILEPTAGDLPRKRGRPKGSKNKPKAATATTASTSTTAKRGPGRPKGSKNKTTSTSSAASSTTAPKRGPGRPKGSTNTPKAASATTAAKRGPGRPKGSKNKTTTKTKTAAKPAAKSTGAKRGPKPGTKIPRDADGNLLKKDGTPRKKPGPKPKPEPQLKPKT